MEELLGPLWQNPLSCAGCHVGVKVLDSVLASDLFYDLGETLVIEICSHGVELKEVCEGAVHEMGIVLVPQLLNLVLTPDYFCSRVAGFCANPSYHTLNEQAFIERVLADKPQFIANNSFIDQLYEEISADPEPRETIRVLHMSDIHIDFEYQVGANTDCGKPVCCREGDGTP